MKTILFILALFCTINIFSQTTYKNSASLIYQTSDNGIGVRLESHNIYASFTKGTYLYPGIYIKTHVKYSVGYLIPTKWAYLSTGLTYHTFTKPVLDSNNYIYGGFNPKILKPFSFEAGFTGKIKRFSIGASTDILKWDGSILIGFNF